jgi:hypothetical protein
LDGEVLKVEMVVLIEKRIAKSQELSNWNFDESVANSIEDFSRFNR